MTNPGYICNRLDSNSDLFPTIAEITLSHMPVLKIDGISILPLVRRDQQASPRSYILYSVNYLKAVTGDLYKLIFPHRYRNYEAFAPGQKETPRKFKKAMLEAKKPYDLWRNPGE